MKSEIQRNFEDILDLPDEYALLFGVVYSFDLQRDVSVAECRPSRRTLKKLDLTEGDDQYECDYLGEEWEGGKHRKYSGTVSRADFEEIIRAGDLVGDTCETGGIVGASWAPSGIGWSPAIAFNGEGEHITSCYVTPLPMKNSQPLQGDESDWEFLKERVLAIF